MSWEERRDELEKNRREFYTRMYEYRLASCAAQHVVIGWDAGRADAIEEKDAEKAELEFNLKNKEGEIGRAEHRGNTVDFIYDKVKIYSNLISTLQSEIAELKEELTHRDILISERDSEIVELKSALKIAKEALKAISKFTETEYDGNDEIDYPTPEAGISIHAIKHINAVINREPEHPRSGAI